MKNLFTPYRQALALKELGFDEDCLARYEGKLNSFGEKPLVYEFTFANLPSAENKVGYPNKYPYQDVEAPTFSQAFKWFREKHNLRSFVDTRVRNVDSPYQWIYDYEIKMGDGITTKPYFSEDFKTYEEAELACIKKLIELVKDKFGS